MGWSGFDITNWDAWANSGVGIGVDNEGNGTISIDDRKYNIQTSDSNSQAHQKEQDAISTFNQNASNGGIADVGKAIWKMGKRYS